jgi:Family of unknown function (DUF6428)
MKISALKSALAQATPLHFALPNGKNVPAHFHITEVGVTTKTFFDCGGTLRNTRVANLQIWVAIDFTHRLSNEKLLNVIQKAEPLFGGEDLDIEVEYQTDTIGRYGLSTNHQGFTLTAKQTDCLAMELCGIGNTMISITNKITETVSACCTPGSGCC